MKHFIIGLMLMHFTAYSQNTTKDTNEDFNSPYSESIDDQLLNRFNPPFESMFLWNDLLQDWESFEINYYEYDSLGRVLKSITNEYPDILLREKEYTYNQSGKILSETNRVFDEISEQMIDDNKLINEYNEFGDITYTKFQVFEEGIWNVLTIDSTEFTYNDDGFQLIIISKNYIDNNLSKISTTINVYDSINRLLSREISVDLGDDDTPFSKVELLYENGNEPIEYTEFEYDSDLITWKETIRYTELAYQNYISFDENSPSHFIIQENVDDSWVNKTLSEFIFNEANSINIISENISGFWILKTRITKNFDEQGLPTLILEEFRNEDNWQTEEADEYINEYSIDFSEINKITLKKWDDEFQSNQNFLMRVFDESVNVEKVKDEMRFSIYPNPAHINVMISANQFSIQSPIFMCIFDINGKVIEQRMLQNKVEQVGLEKLKSGIYFINLSDNKGNVKTEKLIVQ